MSTPYEAVGITAEIAGSLARGIWNQNMLQYPRMQMIEVVDHHEFLVNWCQHKNKVIFQYVRFSTDKTNRWLSIVHLHKINTPWQKRISLKELHYLEGKGMIFNQENQEYVNLKLAYMKVLGT